MEEWEGMGACLAILHRAARGVLAHRVGFEPRPERNGRRNDVAIWREKIPGRGNKRYKDHKAGICTFQGQQRGWMERGRGIRGKKRTKIAGVGSVETTRTLAYVMSKMAGCERRGDVI